MISKQAGGINTYISGAMKIVSACLVGINCKYNGGNSRNEKVVELSKKEKIIPLCPELLAGLGVPREQTEIIEGDGHGVLDGTARVVSRDGKDLSTEFIKAAEKTLEVARRKNATMAVFKARSPSCGSGMIYSGQFDGTLRKGDGVASALLKRNGIKVITEEDL